MRYFLQSLEKIKPIPPVNMLKEDIRLKEDRLTSYFDHFINTVVDYTPSVLSAILVFIIGLWLIKRISILAEKAMIRRDLEVSLRTFLRSLTSIGLKIVLIVTVAGMIGIGTTSFVTILGAAGLAVGLALQGSLSNFAGGVLILIFKPFKVGDSIEAGGQAGEVIEIQIFNTILLTSDHKTVILPNGPLSNGTIVNSSRHGNVRIDIHLSLSSDNNLHHVKKLIREVLNENAKVLKAPEAGVYVGKIADGAVTLNVKPYVLPEDATDLSSELYIDFKVAFEKNGVKIAAAKKDA